MVGPLAFAKPEILLLFAALKAGEKPLLAFEGHG